MRLRKKILTLLVVIVGLGSFGNLIDIPMASPVYAAVTTTDNGTNVVGTNTDAAVTSDSKNTDASTDKTSMEDNFRELADIFLKIGYIILWPLIMLSGIALDNTMVYGEIFHMDLPLRDFRNICKNFANFGLGVMILIAIIKSIFSLGGITKPMETIQKAAIAGILIQMSWFIVAALIDVSTIATYAIGGMPMSLLNKENTQINQKILQPNVTMNVNNEKKIESKDFLISYQVKNQKSNLSFLSNCRTAHDSKNISYIIGRTNGDEKFKNQGNLSYIDAEKKEVKIDDNINACVYLNTVYFFYEFPEIKNLTGQSYNTKLDEIIKLEDNRDGRDACGYIIRVSEGQTSAKCEQASFVKTQKLTPAYTGTRYVNLPTIPKIGTGQGNDRFQNSLATNLGDLIDKSKGFVGPLATIYTSIMDFAMLSDTSNGNGALDKGLGEVILRTGIAAGLIFPLLALTVVLILRIGFLRCVIAASPIIILIKVFDLGKSVGDIGKHIAIENIIKAIFAPVITVFALSISLIFMSALMSTYKNGGLKDGFKAMNIEYQKGAEGEMDSINVFGMIIKYPNQMNTYAGATGDWFSWMILSFSGIGIMWFVLFAAIGASGTIGEVGKKIQTFGENMISTAPIANFGGAKVGLGTLAKNFNPTSDKARRNAEQAWDYRVAKSSEQEEAIRQIMGEKTNTSTGTNGKEVISLLTSGDYGNAKTKLIGTDTKNDKPDNIAQAIFSNKDIDSWVRGLKETDPTKQAEVLKGLKIETQRNNNEKQIDFGKTIDNAKTKDDLDNIIKKEGAEIAKINAGYNKEVKINEKEYTIKVKDGTLIVEDKTATEGTTSTK